MGVIALDPLLRNDPLLPPYSLTTAAINPELEKKKLLLCHFTEMYAHTYVHTYICNQNSKQITMEMVMVMVILALHTKTLFFLTNFKFLEHFGFFAFFYRLTLRILIAMM